MTRRNPLTDLTALFATGLLLVSQAPAQSEHPEGADDPSPGTAPAASGMTPERIDELIGRIDPEAGRAGYIWEFTLEEHSVAVILDPAADRMRIVIPIREADELSVEELTRLMQANFDSALDARYAIGRGVLWATFIHPLSPLSDEQFMLGLGQTANVAATYGTAYTSGLFTFGGGDSAELERRRLLERLRELGTTT